MENILRGAAFLQGWTSAIGGATYQHLNDELSNDGSAGSVLLPDELIKSTKLEVRRRRCGHHRLPLD